MKEELKAPIPGPWRVPAQVPSESQRSSELSWNLPGGTCGKFRMLGEPKEEDRDSEVKHQVESKDYMQCPGWQKI